MPRRSTIFELWRLNASTRIQRCGGRAAPQSACLAGAGPLPARLPQDDSRQTGSMMDMGSRQTPDAPFGPSSCYRPAGPPSGFPPPERGEEPGRPQVTSIRGWPTSCDADRDLCARMWRSRRVLIALLSIATILLGATTTGVRGQSPALQPVVIAQGVISFTGDPVDWRVYERDADPGAPRDPVTAAAGFTIVDDGGVIVADANSGRES